jgi:hypothetical protein
MAQKLLKRLAWKFVQNWKKSREAKGSSFLARLPSLPAPEDLLISGFVC